MKRYIALLVSIVLTALTASAQTDETTQLEQTAPAETAEQVVATDHNTLWDGANVAYNEGDYAKATELYESISLVKLMWEIATSGNALLAMTFWVIEF